MVLRKIYDIVADTTIKDISLSLAETEPDDKYKKKYKSIWKDI